MTLQFEESALVVHDDGVINTVPELMGVISKAQVWSREDDCWRLVQAGDVDNYAALWHDRFIGWPCGQDHPMRKASIGDWVGGVRDKHIHVDSHLVREGAEDFGEVVVVHYRFTRVDTYPDGRVEGKGKESKITHTWMKAASGNATCRAPPEQVSLSTRLTPGVSPRSTRR